jgi:vanillate O-demethylase ferredoxin subunit
MTATASIPPEDLRLLEQVVSDPRFQSLSVLPRFAIPELAVLGGAYGVLALGTWAGIAGWLPYPLVLVLSTMAMFAVFTPLHDAVHRSVSSHGGFNDLVGNLAALILMPGITTRLYRFLHLEHHRYTGEHGKDPDDPFITAPWPRRLLLWTFLDLHWSWFYLQRRHQRPPAEVRAFVVSLGFFIAWHVAWLASPWAVEFLLYWLVPQRLGLTLLVYLFSFIQHPADVEQRQSPFRATRMIRGGRLMRLLLLGQSQHLMHHLFPGVPFYRYDRAWMLGRAAFKERDRQIVWQWPLAWPRRPAAPVERVAETRLQVRITEIRQVAQDVRAYRLEGVDRPLPAFPAGAHVDVHLGPGRVRQYSLCGDPQAPSGEWRIAIKREDAGRGGSRAAHEQLQMGRICELGQPRNQFELRAGSGRVVLVAGGIGVTPLLAMAHALHHQERPFELHLCARCERALPFGDELSALPFRDAIRTHLDDGPAQQAWAAASLPVWQSGDTLYLCGPAGFMACVIEQARVRGWPDEQVVTETFVAAVADPALDHAFTAVLQRSGRSVEVPAGGSLLEALQGQGIELAASCTQGLCGACAVPVIDGEVDHRDRVLGPRRDAPDRLMTTCVSRARGERIVLDL